MGLQANYLTSLGLNFATYKMGIIPYRLARMVRADTWEKKKKTEAHCCWHMVTVIKIITIIVLPGN